jgi:hypothetical protein
MGMSTVAATDVHCEVVAESERGFKKRTRTSPPKCKYIIVILPMKSFSVTNQLRREGVSGIQSSSTEYSKNEAILTTVCTAVGTSTVQYCTVHQIF